ncbi:MAG: TIGR03619 family F420-dependent LLM class oxidoreductase [Thermoleophilia bacterium]|nr:TIGR03619 family F420-dependent LLM class oxidoreductase [Thermoleophilia bacterium]
MSEPAIPARIGVGLVEFPFQAVRSLWKWVDLCEAGGIDGIWHCDRLVSRDPYLESLTFLAAVAGRTERIRIGADVIVIPFRDPLVLAKQCATIDVLSGGRFQAGFGVGPLGAPEWPATGRTLEGRGARSDEAIEIMQRLWTGEPVTFAGRYYHYTDAVIAPTPVQSPLPLWIGGRSDAAVRRLARVGSGWFAGLATPSQVEPVVAAIRRVSAEYGRPVPPQNLGAEFAFHLGGADDPAVQHAFRAVRAFTELDPRELIAVGSVTDLVARIDAFRAVGLHTFALRPLAATDRGVLDQTRRLVEEVLPRFHDAVAPGAAAAGG